MRHLRLWIGARDGHALKHVAVPEPQPSLSKTRLINLLAQRCGFKRYLEICTPTTGNFYAEVNGEHLTAKHRLMYLRPDTFEDGLPIEFSTSERDIAPLLGDVLPGSYDLLFVDSYHEYDTSLRDMQIAFDLLRLGGVMVVHDCCPADEAIATPNFIPDAWVGVTYKAYLDFVIGRTDLRYCTVDADFGCGVVVKSDGNCSWLPSDDFGLPHHIETSGRHVSDHLRRMWQAMGSDYTAAYTLFERHRSALLRLVSPEDFLNMLHPPRPSSHASVQVRR